MDKKDIKNKKFVTTIESEDTLQKQQEQYNIDIIKNASNEKLMQEVINRSTSNNKNKKKVPSLAFTEDPQYMNHHAGIYKLKHDLLPDEVIKKIRVQNLLVAAILRARGNTLSMMGHIRKNRFDVGIEVDVKPELKDYIEPEQMVKIQERIDRFKKLLLNCGHYEKLQKKDKMTLATYLDIQTRNGTSFGKFATEIIRDPDTGEFDRFRPTDAGTIKPAVRKGEAANSIRQSSIKWLESSSGEEIDIDIDKFKEDEYNWVQVIRGKPIQAFTDDEMDVYDLFPSSDVEHNGYPVTPLDTAVNSLITFMNIETYNRLYFQNGRGTRGMVVIRSDDMDQAVLEDMKQQFNASINNVNNSFRTPLFGVGKEDDVQWMPMTAQKRDGEFQFLFDQVARNILAAFNMSPDELPGYAHLSRGTNQQSLSESNNEYKLIAARDTGIRPLILKIQDFFNERLFSLIDPELSQLCDITFAGLDAETKQQESVRLQQDMPIHYDYDTLMDEVEKQPVGDHMGGAIPFNERYRLVLDSYLDTGKVMGEFMNSPSSFVDPLLKYKRDQFWAQNIQMLAQFNPAAALAYFNSRKDSMDILKMLLKDWLDEDETK